MNRTFMGRELPRTGSLTWSDGLVTLREAPDAFVGQLIIQDTEVELRICKKSATLHGLERDLTQAVEELLPILRDVHDCARLCPSSPWSAAYSRMTRWWRDDEDLLENIEHYIKMVFNRSTGNEELIDNLNDLLACYAKAAASSDEFVISLDGKKLTVHIRSLEHHKENIELARTPSGWTAVLHMHQGSLHVNCMVAEAASSPAALLKLAAMYRERFS